MSRSALGRIGRAALAALLFSGAAAEAREALRAPLPAPRAGLGAGIAAGTAGSLFAAAPARREPTAAPAAAPGPAAPGPIAALPAPAASPAPPSSLTGQVAYVLMDLATGRVLEARDPDRPLAPASVTKLVTALYAFDKLGAEHRFATRLVAAGPVRDGILQGDLVLVGGGDPDLDSDALATMAQQAAARVGRVQGGLRVSQGGWPEIARIDDTQPARAAYNPAVAGLNLNYNRVRLAWSRDKSGLTAGLEAHAARWSPPVRLMALSLEGDDCRCPAFDHELPGGGAGPVERWRVRESLLKGEGSVWLPVRAPGLYAGDVLREAAAAAGLALPGPQAGGTAEGSDLAVHLSEPVGRIVASMLRYSTNLTAEVLGLAASRKAGAAARDLAASAAAMNAWAARLGGFPPGDPGFTLANHSGLSAHSRVSPRRMAELLLAAQRHPNLGAELRAALRPHPFAPPPPRGQRRPEAVALAKTGTLNFARGLAGYLTTASGRPLVFAYFANDLARREAGLDDEAPDPGARRWRNAAVHYERELLNRWAAQYD